MTECMQIVWGLYDNLSRHGAAVPFPRLAGFRCAAAKLQNFREQSTIHVTNRTIKSTCENHNKDVFLSHLRFVAEFVVCFADFSHFKINATPLSLSFLLERSRNFNPDLSSAPRRSLSDPPHLPTLHR